MLAILDTLAELSALDEINRSHARQFMALLRSLCVEFNSAIVCLFHPSIQGIASGSGSSGSTGWSNSARFRLYLTDEPGSDRRLLKTVKSNFGPSGEEIAIRWRDGIFEVDDGTPSVGEVGRLHVADRKFLELLDVFTNRGIEVSATHSLKSAPKVFADDDLAGRFEKKDFQAAMGRLLDAGEIRVEEYGSPSKRRSRLVARAAPQVLVDGDRT